MTYSLSGPAPLPSRNAAGVPTIGIGTYAYLCMVAVYFSVSAASPLRDPLYLLPWLIMAELLLRGRMTFRPFALAISLGLIGWLSVSMLQNPSEFAMRELLFVVSSILITLPRYRVPNAFPRLLVIAAAAVCVVIFLGGASRNEFGYVSELTRGIAESEFGLILPVASLLLYLRRDWLWLAASILISYAMYKRIALVALVVAILVDQAALLLRKPHPIATKLLATAFVASSCLISLNSVAFFEFVAGVWSSVVGYAVDPNELTSGRYNATQVFWREVLGGAQPMEWIMGQGIGTSTHAFAVLGNLRLHNFPMLHNDWLRILTDLGLVGVALTSAGLLWGTFSRRRIVALVAVYSTILLMTDNIAGYFIYWAGVVFVVRSNTAHVPTVRDR
jgi:hypothetical protein